jgi:hypothetical protein
MTAMGFIPVLFLIVFLIELGVILLHLLVPSFSDGV